MTILLTGATGLIGIEVGKELVRRGFPVRVLVRNPERAREMLPFPCEIYQWDSSLEVPLAAMKNLHGVVHLAGEPIFSKRWTKARQSEIRDSRVIGTRKLVEAVLKLPKENRPRVFIQASGIGVYGDHGKKVISEDAKSGKDFLAQVCADWEKQVAPLADIGLRVPILRIGVVISGHGGALEQMLPVFSKGLGGKLGEGRQWISWIHIRDIVGIFLFALKSSTATGSFNASAPQPVTNAEFTTALAETLGQKEFLAVPPFLLKILYGDVSEALLTGVRASSAKIESYGYKFLFPDLKSALDEAVGRLAGGAHELVFEQWVPKKREEVLTYFSNPENLEEVTPQGLKSRMIRDYTHEFESMGGGTLLRDRVLLKAPFGKLGALLAVSRAAKRVTNLFALRREKIREIFG